MTEFGLTITYLRIECRALNSVSLGGVQAGERLRNALAAVMLRTSCPEQNRPSQPSAEHIANCPTCWLLAAHENEGGLRRCYSLVPPLPAPEMVSAGKTFSFSITLFGEGINYLPYFILAIPEMGRIGVGPGRGQFELARIDTISPFEGTRQVVYEHGENVVRVPSAQVRFADASCAAASILPGAENQLCIEFLTPLRLVHRQEERETLLKTPSFDIFFQRLLERMDELNCQFANGQRREAREVTELYDMARSVKLLEADTHWVDVFSWSGRKNDRTPLGGLVGKALYSSEHWSRLLPFLLFGQGIQAGKMTVKGNGVFQVQADQIPPYWQFND